MSAIIPLTLPPFVAELIALALSKYTWIMRVPAWVLISEACAFAVGVGLLLLVEPVRLLRFRRGDSDWKVLPLLRKCSFAIKLADWLQTELEIEGMRTLIRVARIILAPVILPLVTVVVLLSPDVLRSIVLLTFVPFTALACFSAALSYVGLGPSMAQTSAKPGTLWKEIKTAATLGGGPAAAWLATAVAIVLTHLLDPSGAVLQWAIGDLPVGMYLVILALVLALAAVATTLHREAMINAKDPAVRSPAAALLAYQRNMTAVLLLGAVVSMWLTCALNPKMFARRSCMGGEWPCGTLL